MNKRIKSFKMFLESAKTTDNVLELTFDLIPIFNVNMYGSLLDPDELLSNMDDDEFNYENYEFDNDKYKEYILSNLKDFLNKDNKLLNIFKKVNPYIEKIDNFSIYSPRQYNYGGDVLYFDLHIKDGFYDYFKDKIEELENKGMELDSFLKDTYSSYPGFSSLMPTNIDELKNMLFNNDDLERGVSAIMAYLLDEISEDIIDEYCDNNYDNNNNYYIPTECFIDYITNNDPRYFSDFVKK